MTAKSWSHILSLFALFILATAEEIAVRSSNSPSLNVSTSLEDYISQKDRQYAADLSSLTRECTDFRTNFQSQLDSLNYLGDQIKAELIETDKKLYPLEFLDDLSKHCVQKYSSVLYSASAARTSFLSCINSAAGNLNSIIYTPENTQRILTNYYNSNWKSGLTDCARKNSASYHNQTLCVMKLIESTNTYFSTNQRNFVTQLEASRCSADSRIRQTIQCVFATLNKASASIGEVNRLVNDCISGIGLCQPCREQPHNETITDQSACPNVLNLYTNSETYQNATIDNPFHLMNRTMDCVLVNFLRPA